MIDITEKKLLTDPLQSAEQRALIDQILAENQTRPGAAMVVLNELQSRIGYVSPSMQAYVAQKLRVPMSEINGVVSFYSFFTTKPRGQHTLKFCMGTACYVGGTARLLEKVRQLLELDPGQTSADGLVTVEVCRCVGACSQAPVVVLDENIYGRVRPNKLPQILRKCHPGDEPDGRNGR
jgi:NADH:ubiquinone oxidoreductase subunit E